MRMQIPEALLVHVDSAEKRDTARTKQCIADILYSHGFTENALKKNGTLMRGVELHLTVFVTFSREPVIGRFAQIDTHHLILEGPYYIAHENIESIEGYISSD